MALNSIQSFITDNANIIYSFIVQTCYILFRIAQKLAFPAVMMREVDRLAVHHRANIERH